MVRRKKQHPTAGFTLIELLVVIAIIGILSSVVLASLSSARAKSRDARRMSDLRQVQTALELYYSDFGRYPTDGAGTLLSEIDAALAPKYIPSLPADPRRTGSSGYRYCALPSSSEQGYTLLTMLEATGAWCRSSAARISPDCWAGAYPTCAL